MAWRRPVASFRSGPVRAGLTALGVWAAVWLYYRAHWPSPGAFVRFVDHCQILFCDLAEVFHPQAQVFLPDGSLVDGYFYTAPFALLLSAFRGVSLDTTTVIWGIAQAVIALGLFVVPLLPREGDAPRPTVVVGLYAFLFAVSTPVLHNVKWGQVSALIVLLVLLCVWLDERGHAAPAGTLLALAIAIKYYPAVFLALFLVRRRWRAVAWSAGTLALLGLVTLAVLGPQTAVGFQLAASAALADMRWNLVPFEPNSQYFVHVLDRLAGGSLPGPASLWTYGGYGLLGAVLLGAWSRARSDATPSRWPPVLLLAATPFFVPTTWPHYLVFLPAVQLAVLDDVRANRSRAMRLWGSLLLAVSAVAASSVFLLEWVGEWGPYSWSGWLLLADGCLLVYVGVAWFLEGAGPNAPRRAAGPALPAARP